MKSARSFFSKAVFLKALLRFWPIWAAYAFIWMLALPVQLMGGLDRPNLNAAWEVLSTVELTALWLCPIAACAAALAVFSHLYSERAANFAASLPVTREGMFLSCAAAGLLPLLAGNALAFLAALAVSFAGGYAALAPLAQWLAAVSLETVAYFGIAALCAMLTGHTVIMPLLFIAANTAAAALGNIALVVPRTFCYGFVNPGVVWSEALSPFIWILNNVGTSHMADGVLNGGAQLYGWGCLAAYGCLGALLLPVCLLCYRHRAMESAGDVVAIAPLRPVFVLVCSAGAAFILGNLFYELLAGYGGSGSGLAALAYSLCMAAAALIGWFAAEMLVHKSFAVFSPRRFAGWAAVSALCAAYVFTCSLDLTGFETRIPAPEDVESVSFYAGERDLEFSDPADIDVLLGLHAAAVEYRDGGGVYFTLDYSLAGGGEMKRSYNLSRERAGELEPLQELMNRPDVILMRKGAPSRLVPGDVYDAQLRYRARGGDGSLDIETLVLTPEEAAELYTECILPDMREGKIGLVWYSAGEEYLNAVCDATVELSFRAGANGLGGWFHTSPTVLSGRTNEWLAARGVELFTLAETGETDPAP